MSKLNVNRVRDLLQEFDFQTLFVEELGWNNPSQKQSQRILVGEELFTYKGVASLGGIEVFEVNSKQGQIPSRDIQISVSKEVAKVRLEHVLIFVDDKRTQSIWFWVKRDGSKRFPREHHFFKGQPGDLFISKIASMAVDLSELDGSGQLPLLEAAKKVKSALDVERAIKKFFRDYDDQRVHFTQLISGIPNEKDRRWYASVLLNRLMFIYFLQKKLFLDEGDQNYLENKLRASQQRGSDQYYSGFLQALFFEAFAKPEGKRSESARQLTGKIKYLNGGLFLQHKLEQQYTIEVPDKAFEELYTLFGRYSWNLNDIPGETDDDINPSVLGYIFEKYINQKEFGAYYTRPEITEYLCEQTIYRLILDKTTQPDIEGFPAGRKFDSVPELLTRLDVPMARKLLHEILPSLTILDPAVGSGAFLVAALKTLITVYSAVIGWLRFHDKGWLDNHLKLAWKIDPEREQYAIKKAIITDNLYGVDLMEEATEIAKLRLFMTLVASAKTADDLEPLPNIDFNILAGNSLIGLMRVDDAEFEEWQRKSKKTASLFDPPKKTYRQILAERNRKVETYKYASGITDDLISLRADVERVKAEAGPVLAEILEHAFSELGVRYEEATWDEKKWELGKPIKRAVNSADCKDMEPFHWGFEFDQILHQRGGFDAIITNPPWESLKPQDKEFFMNHSELVSKNKMTITEFDEHKGKFMKDPDLRKAYLSYLSDFPHISAYFRAAPEYSSQSAIVNGKKTGTDVNLYKLFTERCFHLLRNGGLCGIVIPSGFYTDLGATGLRRLLFERNEVTGLFCFENRKVIFEGVDSRFKFVVLSYRKGGTTESFPAAFMRHEVSDLARFPNSLGFEVSMSMVRSLSPEPLSLVEIKSELDASILNKSMKYPVLGEKGNASWHLDFTREFDMTNDKRLFQDQPTEKTLPLFEGKYIWQYQTGHAPVKFYINIQDGRSALLGRRGDTGQVMDYQCYRLGFRDIASSTNERTLVSTLIPPGFHGNKLPTVKTQSEKGTRLIPYSVQLYVCGVWNSFLLDWMIRLRVTTTLNYFYLYQLPIPRLTKADRKFAPFVHHVARLICTTEVFADLWNEVFGGTSSSHEPITTMSGSMNLGLAGGQGELVELDLPDTNVSYSESIDPPPGFPRIWTPSCGAINPQERAQLRAELDAMVAHLYGLTEEEFRHILSTFPLVDKAVKDQALSEFLNMEKSR